MKNTIDKIVDDIELPTVAVKKHEQLFFTTLMHTKKSAAIGILFLVLPFLFLSGVILKHYLHVDFGIFTAVYEWIGALDRKYGDASAWNWAIRLLLLLGPLVALAVNLLAITHFRYEKANRAIVLVLKIKWLNILLIAVCTGIVVTFFSYLLIENS